MNHCASSDRIRSRRFPELLLTVIATAVFVVVVADSGNAAARDIHPFGHKPEKTTVFAVGLLEWEHQRF